MCFVLTGWTFISIETERGEQPACLNCLVDFISVRKQETKAFKNVGKSWGFVLRFFFPPKKAKESISELFGTLHPGRKNKKSAPNKFTGEERRKSGRKYGGDRLYM